MSDRRIIGIDLGIATSHVAVIVDGTGKRVAKRSCRPELTSLQALETVALDGAEDTMLDVVMEPTGAAWMPVAAFFAARGHRVHRVSSNKSASLRRFLNEHAKTNTVDAETLARLVFLLPDELEPLELASTEAAGLDRRVRACHRLTKAAVIHKVRLRELARQVMPLLDEAIEGQLTLGDVALLERYGDPRALIRAGRARVTAVIKKASHGGNGVERAEAWLRVARAAVAVFGPDGAPFEDVAAEVATEARLLRTVLAEQQRHAEARESAYRKVDPGELARSLPGVAEIGGPVIVAAMGRPGRFPDGGSFKRFTGLAPKASETGDSDRKGQAMSKAGPRLLRHQLVQSANIARRLDPQLAHAYFTQMTERGAHHQKAVCVVAARLAERTWAVMARGEPYVLRDLDGREVSAEEARTIIAERYTVPEDVRRRRRTRKHVGKAPQQVLEGTSTSHTPRRGQRGDLPRPNLQSSACSASTLAVTSPQSLTRVKE